jgi:hypothetical protein
MKLMFGKYKENGVWVGSASDWRWMWRGHDCLYVAAGWLRLRIMKPSWHAKRRALR